MPIYKVTVKGDDTPRLVKAKTKAGAINHVLKGYVISADQIDGEDLFALASDGTPLEDASANEAPEPAASTEGEQSEQTDDDDKE